MTASACWWAGRAPEEAILSSRNWGQLVAVVLLCKMSTFTFETQLMPSFLTFYVSTWQKSSRFTIYCPKRNTMFTSESSSRGLIYSLLGIILSHHSLVLLLMVTLKLTFTQCSQ